MKREPGSCSGGGRGCRVFEHATHCGLCGREHYEEGCPFAPYNDSPLSATPESWREQYRAARAKMLGKE